MSDVRALYSALAELVVSFKNEEGRDVSITGRDLHKMKTNEIGALPVRILTPFKERGSGASDLRLLTVGTSNVFGTMTWRIADIMLLCEAGERYGIYKVLPDLVRYSGAYAERIADAGADLGIGTMTYTGLQLDAALIEWPMGSGQEYYGVEAILSYEELINP